MTSDFEIAILYGIFEKVIFTDSKSSVNAEDRTLAARMPVMQSTASYCRLVIG